MSKRSRQSIKMFARATVKVLPFVIIELKSNPIIARFRSKYKTKRAEEGENGEKTGREAALSEIRKKYFQNFQKF